jgi:hypothetical protein
MGGRKLLNYPKYTKNLDPNAHVHVFKQAIKVNGVTQECTKFVYFQWTLQDMTLTWEDNFVNNHPDYTFNKFAQVFYTRYNKVQMDEQVNMTLKIIKQNLNKKVKEYYKQILNL